MQERPFDIEQKWLLAPLNLLLEEKEEEGIAFLSSAVRQMLISI